MNGHIDMIFLWHAKQNLDASGKAPEFIKPEVKTNESKKRIILT